MNRHDKISVKWRLFFYLVVFTGILLVLLWLFQIVFLENFYTAIKTRDVESSAKIIADNINNDDLSMLIDSISRQNGMSASIISPDGTELYGSDFGRDSIIVGLLPEDLAAYYQKAVSAGGTTLDVFHNIPPLEQFDDKGFIGDVHPPARRIGQSIVYAAIVPTARYGDVMVLLDSVITPVDATVETLQVQLVYITVIMLALSFFLAFLMARHISRPIISTTESAKELARGEYGARFDAHGYREIAELNRTLRYAASELSKVAALQRELIANISHDLRTPLTMIAGYAEVMRDIPGENTPENVQVIIDETNRLNELVSDILDLSKLQSGTQRLSPQPFDLTSCIREIMKRYTKLMEQEGYRIVFLAGEDVWVHADAVRISQVIYNLINNAVNYTGADRRVEVRQILKDGAVRIEVSDTGSGIAPEDLERIWDRYYKVDQSHKRAAIGAGLGLSIVRSILTLHGAAYGVVSSQDCGSTFWFELPALSPPDVSPD